MAWYRFDGVFPFYWWEQDELEETPAYDGAFPLTGKPITRYNTSGQQVHVFSVYIKGRRYRRVPTKDRRTLGKN